MRSVFIWAFNGVHINDNTVAQAMSIRPALILFSGYLNLIVATELAGSYRTETLLVHLPSQRRHPVNETFAVQMVYLMLEHTCRKSVKPFVVLYKVLILPADTYS